MTRASQSDVDELLAAVRQCFPDPELYGPLAEDGAIDDVPKELLGAVRSTLLALPTAQQLLLGTYRALGASRAKRGEAPEPLEGERATLAVALRAEVEAYCPNRKLTESLADVLPHLPTTKLTELCEQVRKLRVVVREELLDLLAIDDAAEARAAETAATKQALGNQLEAMAASGQALRDQIAEQRQRAEAQRDERRAASAARHAALAAAEQARAAAKAQRDAAREQRHAEMAEREAQRDAAADERKAASAAAKAARDAAREERHRRLAAAHDAALEQAVSKAGDENA
jgi:hypothetical protein